MKKGFTLIELLVVVLIIGILAAVALPQYEIAVAKSRISTLLPLMRRWYDALAVYKLETGSYGDQSIDSELLGVSWPSDWNGAGTREAEKPGQWYCAINENTPGEVMCTFQWFWLNNDDEEIFIYLHQPDTPETDGYPGKRTCESHAAKGHKICKALGGKLIKETTDYNVYEF